MVLQLFTLLGALGMFLYGMNMMSMGLQKAAGNKLRGFLAAMTSNPIKSVGTGLTITSIIQSSSATTVMVVGFVNAGLLALDQAIGVIMGANIGTTVTAWLVSLLGFKADISIMAVPLMAVGFILSIAKKEKYRNISEFVIGFSLLFLGLSLMKNSVPDLQETPEVLAFIKQWTGYGFGSVLIFLIFGTVLTLVLQSSSATMALTLIMLSMGWLPFEMAAAMVFGENIGTTITANVAAAIGNPNARRAALAHTIFNLLGVIWALALFRPFLSLVGILITWLGYPNPTELVYTGTLNPASDESTAALYGVSMLHTLFNVINAVLLIGFIPQLTRLVTAVIKDKPKDEDDKTQLKYINAGNVATAEIAIAQAQKEVVHFAQISRNGLDYVRSALNATTEDEFEIYRKKLVKYEEIADRIEYEIATFLGQLPQDEISDETRNTAKKMYRIIGELESLGDSGESITRIITRRNIHGKRFSEIQIKNINTMIDLVGNAYGIMIGNLQSGLANDGLRRAVDCEIKINDFRNDLREAELSRTDSPDYQSTAYYIDTVSALERMGDYIINVTEALK